MHGLLHGRAGRYRVTATAQQLLALMRAALAEAARCGSPARAQSLCAAAVDIADLAGALPPALRPKTLQARALSFFSIVMSTGKHLALLMRAVLYLYMATTACSERPRCR